MADGGRVGKFPYEIIGDQRLPLGALSSTSSASTFWCSLKELMLFSLHFGKLKFREPRRRAFCRRAWRRRCNAAQVSGISPFEECHLADHFRHDPAALLHFLCGNDSPHHEALFFLGSEGAA
jgi:hypothetical protein